VSRSEPLAARGPRAGGGIRAWLQLLRVGTLFSPAADVVAGACLLGLPWSPDLVRASLASVLVYAGGMVLNDHADRREDAVQRPERPIPSGRIRPGQALASGLALLAAGVALAPWRPYWAMLAGLVLVYDYAAKRHPLAAAPVMGLLRGLNLLGGAAIAAWSWPGAGAWPGAEVVLLPALAYALYILAVTLLGAYEDQPKVSPRAVIGVQSVPPIVGLLGLLALPSRGLAQLLGLALALAFLGRIRRVGRAWDRAAIRSSMTWLLLGTMAYTALLCAGSGRPLEAIAIGCAILPARAISRRIALT
jgi:4-hydroxybenzoate polyprenyltransferase